MSDLNQMLSEFVDINAMVNEVSRSEKKTSFWRPTKNKTTIRILPPIKANGELVPWAAHSVHWISGQPYECINQTSIDKDGNLHSAEECPVCKMAKNLYAAKTDEALELAKRIGAKTRYVVRILVRDDPEYAEKPVFYEMPFKVYEKVKSAITSKEWGSVVGPLDGRDFDLIKTGEGKYTNYDQSTFKPITSKILDDQQKLVGVLQEAKNMPYNSLMSFKTKEELKNAAMDNSDIERFFAPKETIQVPGFTGDEIPETIVIGKPATETPAAPAMTNDDLDAILAGLV